MADTAFQTAYRNEFIYSFEDRATRLRGCCVTEAQYKGNSAVFLVSDSGNAAATTRGVSGLIAARADNNTQLSCTLEEWNDLVRKTNFNVFASQADQRRLMQETTMSVINRKMDDLIIAQLDTATNDTGAAVPATLDMAVWARTILGNNFVDLSDEDNIFGLISPGFDGYMMQIPEYASADYVEVKPFAGPGRMYRRWMGVNWITHPRLTGSVGAGGAGSNELCYMFHRNAIGIAVDTKGLDSAVGYDEEQAYSWARVSVFMGAKLLQNSGVVQMKHDASSYAAQ